MKITLLIALLIVGVFVYFNKRREIGRRTDGSKWWRKLPKIHPAIWWSLGVIVVIASYAFYIQPEMAKNKLAQKNESAQDVIANKLAESVLAAKINAGHTNIGPCVPYSDDVFTSSFSVRVRWDSASCWFSPSEAGVVRIKFTNCDDDTKYFYLVIQRSTTGTVLTHYEDDVAQHAAGEYMATCNDPGMPILYEKGPTIPLRYIAQ